MSSVLPTGRRYNPAIAGVVSGHSDGPDSLGGGLRAISSRQGDGAVAGLSVPDLVHHSQLAALRHHARRVPRCQGAGGEQAGQWQQQLFGVCFCLGLFFGPFGHDFYRRFSGRRQEKFHKEGVFR